MGFEGGVVGRVGRKSVGLVGYLPEGGVDDAGPEAGGRVNRLVLDGWAERLRVGGGDLVAEVVELESGMARVAELLRRSQPGREGRLLVRWWLLRGDGDLREPVLVRAVRTKGGKERYVRVDQRARPKETEEWAVNADQVRVALRAWWLMEKRRRVLLGRLRRALVVLGRAERLGVGDWRYELVAVENGIELAQGRMEAVRLAGSGSRV